MQNMTEIIFGDSLYHQLKESEISKNNSIIKFDIMFSISDLSDVDKNILYLNDEYCSLIKSELVYEFNNKNSLDSIILKLSEAIKNKNKIRIWTTHKQIDAYLMLLFICNYFSTIDYDLYVLYSDDYNKECYSPSCMNESELKELLNYEHKLSVYEKEEYSNKWNQIVKDNSDMRVIANGEVLSVSFDYYNEIIINKLRELGEVKTVVLIANLLKDIHLYDTVFTYLINRLVNAKKITITDNKQRILSSTIKIDNSK